MLKQILIWLVIAWIGGCIVYFSQYLSDAFGRIAWFENNLWSTKSGYVVCGFGVMIIGFLILFGIIPTSSPTENLWSITTWV